MASDSVFGTPMNGDSVNLTRGMIVRISATNAVLRAQADSTAHLAGMYGIVLSGSVAPGGPVNAAPSATRCPVLLETGLTPVAGQALYVSASVPGRCTNVAPVGIPFPIGFIENAASYTNDSFVFASVMVSAVAAADFAKLAGAGGSGSTLAEQVIVTEVDGVAGGDVILAPGLPGHVFFPSSGTWRSLFTEITGIATGNWTFTIGDNVAKNNMTAAAVTFTAAALNNTAAALPLLGMSANVNGNGFNARVPGAACYLSTSLVPTGVTACKMLVTAVGVYLPG